MAAEPEVILLPDDPFWFSSEHVEQFTELFCATPAAQNGHILLVDGSLITWAGTRLARAFRDLPALFDF